MTLVEMIIAIAVFSIIILASTAVSATYLTSRTSIKKYQANSEELSVAMNYLAKDIRMSNCMDGACDFSSLPNSFKIYNNDTGLPIIYTFKAADKTLTRNGDIIISNVTGKFYAINTGANQIARITISMQKDGVPAMLVQTTVSMRNKYKEGT